MVDTFIGKDESFSDKKWHLQIMLRNGVKTVPLKNSELFIGRSNEADINVDDSMASRKHARFYFENGFWWLQDLESSNGIYVEGRRVNNAKVSAGSHFKIGSALFTLLDKEASQVAKKIKKAATKNLVQKRILIALSGTILTVGMTFALLSEKAETVNPVQVVDPLKVVKIMPASEPDQEASKKTVDHEGISSFSGRGIVKNEAEEENTLKTKELYRAGLLFYDNGNLKKAIDQWDLALTYDKRNSLVMNKLAKAVEELDYLIDEHYKNGKMHLKYSRLNQAVNDFTIVVELAREKKDMRYLDALEQLELIRK